MVYYCRVHKKISDYMVLKVEDRLRGIRACYCIQCLAANAGKLEKYQVVPYSRKEEIERVHPDDADDERDRPPWKL